MNDKSSRVFRGGCWNSDARYVWVANRSRLIPSLRSDDIGVRLFRIVSPLEQLAEVSDE